MVKDIDNADLCNAVIDATAAPHTTRSPKSLFEIDLLLKDPVPDPFSGVLSEVFATGHLAKTPQLTAIPSPGPNPLLHIRAHLIRHIKAVAGRTDYDTGAAGETLLPLDVPDLIMVGLL